MREMTIPESGSKRKLLDAAELLFAEKGFEAVSVRDITQHSKTNVAAVNYHFGSRDNLLALVMMRYMTPVTEERLLSLDKLEKRWAGKPVPLEEIIDALVRPLVSQVKKSELAERLFYKLTGRICAEQGNGLPPQIEDQFRQVGERFSKAFAKTLTTIPREELAWRVHFIIGGMIHMLTHQELLLRVSSGASGAPTMEITIERFIRFAAAGLRQEAGIEGSLPGDEEPWAGNEVPLAGVEEALATIEEPLVEIKESLAKIDDPLGEIEAPSAEIEELSAGVTEIGVASISVEIEEPSEEIVVPLEEVQEALAAIKVLLPELEEPLAEIEEPSAEIEKELKENHEPEAVVEKPVKISPQITFDF